MGLKYLKKTLVDFASEESLRCDFKYLSLFNREQESYQNHKNLFSFVENERVDLSNLNNIQYAEIGDINSYGKIKFTDLSINEHSIENERLVFKIRKGDIINPKKGDILIAKIRPYLKKNVLVTSENQYFTKAFIQVRPKINPELLYLIIMTILIDKIDGVSRLGKGYPTISKEDIKSIRFPIINEDEIEIHSLLNCSKEIQSGIDQLENKKENINLMIKEKNKELNALVYQSINQS